MYGDATIDVSSVKRWAKRFSSVESDIDDELRRGRPATAVTGKQVRLMHSLKCIAVDGDYVETFPHMHASSL